MNPKQIVTMRVEFAPTREMETGNARTYLLQVGKAGKVRRSKKPPGTQLGKRMRCDETGQDLCGDGERWRLQRASWQGRSRKRGAREQGIVAMEKCFCMRGLCFVFGGEDGGGSGTAPPSPSPQTNKQHAASPLTRPLSRREVERWQSQILLHRSLKVVLIDSH